MKLTCAIGYLITALILGFCIRTIAKSKKNIAEGHFLRANNSAKKLFDIEEKNTEAMKELEEGFLEWLQERNVEEYDGHVWDKVEKIHGEERHLSFKFHCMWGHVRTAWDISL